MQYKKINKRSISKESVKLNGIYKVIAEKYNCFFLDNQVLETGTDGFNLNRECHKILANRLKI